MVHCIVRNVKKECWIKSLCFLLNSNISHISKLFSWNQSTDYNWFHGSFCWWILQFHKSGSISKHIFWNKRNVTRRNQNRKVDERWRKNKSNIYQKEPSKPKWLHSGVYYVNVRKIKKAQKGPYEKQSAIIFVVSIYVQMSTVKFDKVGLVFFKANRSYRTKHNVNTCHSGGRMSTNR